MIHPAVTMPFDELCRGLEAEVEAGNVSVQRDGSLALYSYTPECAFGKKWNQFSLISRGLILDLERREIVALPFPKFFNYGEGWEKDQPPPQLPDEPFEVTMKVDGSLGIIFFHDNQWRVTTRGSFRSEQALWATEWLHQNQQLLRCLDPNWTYLTEIVYNANRIVVQYEFEGLVLLAAYNKHDGYEMLPEQMENLPIRIRPTWHGMTIEDLLEAAKTLPVDREGFVVRFASGLRVKIKGDEYCRVHRILSNVHPLGVWEMVVAGDDPATVKSVLPEEFHRDFDFLWGHFNNKALSLWTNVQELYYITQDMSDKELGLWLQTAKDHYSENYLRFIFPSRKKQFLEEFRIGGSKARRAACETFRPTGNRLEGYVPSNAMNRFGGEG